MAVPGNAQGIKTKPSMTPRAAIFVRTVMYDAKEARIMHTVAPTNARKRLLINALCTRGVAHT